MVGCDGTTRSRGRWISIEDRILAVMYYRRDSPMMLCRARGPASIIARGAEAKEWRGWRKRFLHFRKVWNTISTNSDVLKQRLFWRAMRNMRSRNVVEDSCQSERLPTISDVEWYQSCSNT
jgi:hypothetical protein